jgi:hypothetical protein
MPGAHHVTVGRDPANAEQSKRFERAKEIHLRGPGVYCVEDELTYDPKPSITQGESEPPVLVEQNVFGKVLRCRSAQQESIRNYKSALLYRQPIDECSYRHRQRFALELAPIGARALIDFFIGKPAKT